MEEPITAKQKHLVQSSFHEVVPISDMAATIFYDTLFNLDPSLKPLFKDDIKSQGRKLMTMLGAAVAGLDNLDTLIPIVHNLGKRHVGYGVKPEHYETVGMALLITLERGLGELWNEELKEAWVAVYNTLADVMMSVEME